MSGLIQGEYAALNKRKITEATCKKFHYQVGEHNGKNCHIANYYNSSGDIVAQKIRYQNKDFKWLGDHSKVTLFGENQYRDGGRLIVLTSGEIDALSFSQLQGNKYPVVSIPDGDAAASKAIAKSIEWLEKFESVVFLFDQDKSGREAAKECAALLTPRKAKIATFELKDANAMLVAGKGADLMNSMWDAKVFAPDGIVSANDTWEKLIEENDNECIPYCWDGLNNKTAGLRKKEIVTFAAGSGQGKSQICREIAHDLLIKGEKLAYIALEENVQRSVRGLVSIGLNKPIHLPDIRKEIPEKEMKEAWNGIKDNCFFYDHWGSLDSDNLLNKIKYFVHAYGCQWIVLDHLSIVISGQESSDERRLIDNTMTKLRSLVEELNIGVLLVSHLKRLEGNRDHTDGAVTSLAHLRGSAAIAQLSDMVIGLERNQQSDTPDRVTIRVLKNRFSGDTGIATYLNYDKDTGRLSEEGSTNEQAQY